MLYLILPHQLNCGKLQLVQMRKNEANKYLRMCTVLYHASLRCVEDVHDAILC